MITEPPPFNPIGQMLVEVGLITAQQLEHAIAEQAGTGRSLGQVLIDSRVISEFDLATVIARRMGMECVDLSVYPIASEVARSVPEELAREARALPIRREGERVIVAMVDPSNYSTVKTFESTLGAQVVAVFATEEHVDRAIDDQFATDTRGVLPARKTALDATVVFTDIVGSTDLAASLGPARWRVLLTRHHEEIRRHVFREWGREVNTWGDEFFLLFRDPTSAVACLREAIPALRAIGIDIRAGAHHGQVEWMATDVIGVAVHVAARVRALAEPREVLVTQAVVDHAPELAFVSRGEHDLKGVPGTWLLHAVS